MVEIEKGHDHNRPLTVCRITSSGRTRYLEYLQTLEQVVRDAEKGSKPQRSLKIVGELAPSPVNRRADQAPSAESFSHRDGRIRTGGPLLPKRGRR